MIYKYICKIKIWGKSNLEIIYLHINSQRNKGEDLISYSTIVEKNIIDVTLILINQQKDKHVHFPKKKISFINLHPRHRLLLLMDLPLLMECFLGEFPLV